MRDWKSVPMPKLMEDNCPRDQRGLPVPYVVFKDAAGGYHFKINDTYKTIKCMSAGLCTICGTKMDKDNVWLVGGIASAFDERGCYIDHPVHKECAHYALQVCPYLAIRNYNSKMDLEKLQDKVGNAVLLNDPTVDQDRLPLFVLIRPSAIHYQINSTYTDIKLKAEAPYHEIEYWTDGKIIPDLDLIPNMLHNTKWEQYLDLIMNQTYLK